MIVNFFRFPKSLLTPGSTVLHFFAIANDLDLKLVFQELRKKVKVVPFFKMLICKKKNIKVAVRVDIF